MSRISVIIPNYNHAKYIEQAIKTSLHQSVEPFEIIVVDDASTDNSIEVLNRLQTKYPKIRMLRNEERMGVNHTLNRGAELAQGEYLLFRAADDITLPGFFEVAAEMLDKYPEAALCCGDIEFFHINAEQGSTERFLSLDKPTYLTPDQFAATFTGNSVNASAFLIRKSIFIKEGKFDPEAKWNSDWLLCLALAFRYGICYVPQAVAAFRLDPGSLSNSVITRLQEGRDLFGYLLEVLTEEYRDILPYLMKSGALSIFGTSLGEYVMSNPTFWRTEIYLLIQQNLRYWNRVQERNTRMVGIGGVIHQVLKEKQSLIKKHQSIGIWGAGEHTRLLLEIWTEYGLPPVKCILVSEERGVRHFSGLPVFSVDKLQNQEFDLIVVSSKSYESAMLEKSRQYFPQIDHLTFWS